MQQYIDYLFYCPDLREREGEDRYTEGGREGERDGAKERERREIALSRKRVQLGKGKKREKFALYVRIRFKKTDYACLC